MIYFTEEDDILSECERLLREDLTPSQDRSNISAFYNGLETLSPGEAQERNVSSLTNHLLGFDSLKAAHEQLFSIYTRPKNMWEVKVQGPFPEVEKDRWGMEITKHWNEVIKDCRRLKPEWNGSMGEVVLHGRSVMMHLDNWDWCPKMRMLYVPRGTGTVPESITYGCIPDRISVSDLERYLKQSKSDRSSWNMEALNTALESLKDQPEPPINTTSNNAHTQRSPEVKEYDLQSGVHGDTYHRTSIPVYYYYEVDHSKSDRPVSLQIVVDYNYDFIASKERDGVVVDKTLFKKDAHFKSVHHWIHMFFVDCNIGGPTNYHRTLGLGRLNYESDVDTEEFFNEYMQGVRESMRRVYKMNGSSDVELARQFMAEFQNVLPENIEVQQFQNLPNFQHALAPLQFLRQQTKANAGAGFSNLNGGMTGEELEVQALERQGRSANAVAHRMSDVYECLDSMGAEVYRRFAIAPNPSSSDGYSQVKEFRDRMAELGIPIGDLSKMRNGKFMFLQIRANREAGDGNQVMEQMVNQTLIQNLGLYSPEAQQVIKRKFTASLTKDSNLAEALVPVQQEPDPDQEMDASNENDQANREGILGQPIPTRKKDIDLRHIPVHMKGLQALVAKGQVRGWDEIDVAAFQALASHTVIHIQQHGSIRGNESEARGMMQMIQNLSSMGDKFVQNMQAQKEAQNITPIEQERIATMQHNRQMDVRKQSSLEKDREDRKRIDLLKIANDELDSVETQQQFAGQ